MNGLDWPTPAPGPLAWISPSSAAAMQTCQLRLAFQLDAKTSGWVRGSTRTALGIVAHRLTELVWTGHAPTTHRRDWLEDQWTALLEEERRALIARWPGSLVPPASEWPGVTATRVRLLRRLEGIKAKPKGAATPGHVPSASVPALPWVERMLQDQTRGIRGVPDRVERSDGALRVVDLKSGAGQSAVTPDQRRQLLVYAHLVNEEIGYLPHECVVVDVRGRETCVAVGAAQVRESVEELEALRDGFSASLATGAVPASPSPSACAWCPFKIVCKTYWQARNETWSGLDVRGEVAAVLHDGSIRLGVAAEDGSSSSFRVIWHGEHRPGLGASVAVVDLQRAGPGTGRMRWWSRWRVA
ncbi:MAG: PD-(D/E)XK nuclease family protein [Actinomycetales bacterium]|nr:MAG: PD-(D/E)XK nuclease family protein [Actinomycetales bacterium]